jgi:hypothetical protein
MFGVTPAEYVASKQRELSIGETPEDQAIAAFMEEREVLKGTIDFANEHTGQLLAQLTEANAALAEERVQAKEMEDILIQSAYYHLALRDLLVRIGIGVHTGDDGKPTLSIDLPTLANSVEAYFAG